MTEHATRQRTQDVHAEVGRSHPGGAGPVPPASGWPRLGLHRTPWLTATVFAVTAVVGVAQQVAPALLGRLQRAPAGLHGQWWRVVTALVVQDGGVIGLVSNLIFLAAVGAAAEQVLSRRRWMVQYLGIGLLAELVGYVWQPVGGGNSIAICGLASALAVATWRDRGRSPRWCPSALLLWCGALLAALWPPLIALGIAGGVLAGKAARAGRRLGLTMMLTVVGTGVVLSAASNIHGAALLMGAVIALIRRPRRT